jgi:hypothetical protein
MMYGLIGSYVRKSTGKLKSSEVEGATSARASLAEGRFIYQLKSHPAVDIISPPAAGPPSQKVPDLKTLQFRDQKPQAQHIARQTIGEKLSYFAFNALGIGWFYTAGVFGPMRFYLRGMKVFLRTAFKEPFF